VQVVNNKAILLTLRDPNKVTGAITNSKDVGDNKVLVKWGVDEVLALRKLNIDAPAPILGQYNWPGKHAPFNHQRVTSAFLTANRRAFCFNEQGTGKTASAIWASDFLLSRKVIKRVLIICPLSIMDSAWRDDLFTFAMHRKVDIAYGAPEKRRAILRGDAEYVIINYDGVEIVQEDIANGGFDLIIVDEATHYKNAQTRRWRALSRLVTSSTWLWMMTGTPAAQSPLDAYGLAKLVNPNNVPRFFGSFRDQVMFKVSRFKWAIKESATETVFNALQPAIRWTKAQCLDLPDMVFAKRVVELTPQQRKYYKMLKSKMTMQAAGEEVTAVNAAVNMNKLLQISAGAVYTDNGEALEFDITNRYRVMMEAIEEAKGKVLVFVPFRHTINILSEKLSSDGVTNEVIQGDVPVSKRTDIFRRFQEQSDPRVLVIQPAAASHGVTLTAADTVVWWAPTSSLETYLQANARVHRAGQKNKCTVIQLYGSPVEKHVYALLDSRIDVHTKVIDLYKELLD
jgi:SNF2 family DNA or RNA helicase